MTKKNELERLEGFVASLLDKFNLLQAENAELTERLQKREVTIGTLEEELAEMKDERGEISNRVGSLIDKIEEWESSNGPSATADEAEENDSESKSETGAQQGNLFSVDSRSGAGSE